MRIIKAFRPRDALRKARDVTEPVVHTSFADADAQMQFMKNVAMSGGFIFIAAFGPGAYAVARAWRRDPAIS
jgi:uncharacterized membrane protein YphA (DoxX/SURF4 family)